MAIYQFEDAVPVLGRGAWVAETAQVIGKVHLQDESSVWPGAVIRGDVELISVGRRSNVQDLSLLHADFGSPLHVGDKVTIGHQVTLHGCTVGEGTLVGIAAKILTGARIGRNCVVGAGALVTEGKSFPDGVLIIGAPAKVARELSEAEIRAFAALSDYYVDNALRFSEALRRLD